MYAVSVEGITHSENSVLVLWRIVLVSHSFYSIERVIFVKQTMGYRTIALANSFSRMVSAYLGSAKALGDHEKGGNRVSVAGLMVLCAF